MPDLPWLTVEEGIQELREIRISEKTGHLRATDSTGRAQKTLFIFVRGVPARLKSSMTSLLCRTHFTVEIAVTDLQNPNAMRGTGSKTAEAKWQHSNTMAREARLPYGVAIETA